MALKSERDGIDRSKIALSHTSCGSGDGRIVKAGDGTTVSPLFSVCSIAPVSMPAALSRFLNLTALLS
jgi:hypothetical protein